MTIKNKPFFSSWSGGKDSCLALYRAIKEGGIPRYLFTMFQEDGKYSRAHNLPTTVLKKQAEALQIQLLTRNATWNSYEKHFLEGMEEMKKQGVFHGVFGDIDLDGHLEWVERVCASVNVSSYHPLWKEKRRAVLDEFIELGFKATIIVLKEAALPKTFLGKVLDKELVQEIESLGVDACGEEGEFHTVVTDGPIFFQPVQLVFGEEQYREGYWYQTVNA
ncbi:diphthine--ammonia ligase [Bacillus aquiflavi]|uniref:Dph6-related ATP pyrophosphatase n=1 Tax=Bacillus aquiflavi TaxID=2672567 RepID=UPI001CA9C4C7|nr:diphthine--ammonia ligase [Bacillus aquiflavi]UAC48449.1 diphthine--ammonia ligase [Bacillus aquiflavi]